MKVPVVSERVCKQILCSVLLGAVFSSSGYSSTTVAVIASQGIVLGADQKAVARCDAPCPPGMESPRVVFVQDRVAMGTAGLYAVVGYSHFVAPYYFPSLVGRIKNRLTNDAAVSHVSEVVEAEAAKIFLWFDQYLRLRIVKQDDFPGDSPVEYLIAGYQGGVPTIYSVHLDVDWQQLHLKGVQRVLLHPELHNAENLRIYGVGSKRLLQQLAQRQGALYRRLLSSAPLESRMLIDQKEISLKQAGNLVRAVLEIEALANPDQVSPPFTIVTIPNDASPQ